MRIATGLFRSRIIKAPKHIRATQDKVRKALFDILQNQIKDSDFLELFAGSGAIGIEAMSNGAKGVVFVEKDRQCCKIIRDNLAALGLVSNNNPEANIFILATDVIKGIEVLYKNNKKFDIIFLDPPYYLGLAKKNLQKLCEYDILRPCGLIVVEHNKKDELEKEINSITCFKQNRYGDKVLSFYRNK